MLGLVFLAPNFLSKEDAEGLPSFIPSKQISLGLDLQGGVLEQGNQAVQVVISFVPEEFFQTGRFS